ncbi:hypothetical protein N7520_001736 [Penicillium odoratum]|uniref:uncharacterized protein n=1 Tax=Penicillium odoratum TaxID=1167516 RepID=UPI0025472000|nr:uncharacterized protein N7520_001736 [Penicillium odoratum]KAJ5778490.1 hypothetical protein N7520_001736 [Penicillium odoratum]
MRTLIRPSIPIGHVYAKLTPLDQYMARVVLPLMCIFKLDESGNRASIVRSLQVGLAHTIDEINIIAATVIPEDAGRGTIQLEYEENAGVIFYENDLPEIQFDALAARQFSYSELTVSRFSPEPWGHSSRCPVISVKATFITGGLILAFNGHHAVMDAQALGTFAHTWARNFRAESDGLRVTASQKISPDASDGSNFFGGHSTRPMSDFQSYWKWSECSYQETQRQILEHSVAGDHLQLKSLVALSHWSLSPEAMNGLKEVAQPPSSDQPIVTEISIVSALVWRHLTRARQRAGIEVGSSSLLSSVNVRRRVDPPLPLEYLGNAIVLARAHTTAADLVSDDEGSLYALAHQIVDSIDWWTPDRIWELAGSIDASANVYNLAMPAVGYDVVVTSPSRLGDILKEISWGTDLGPLQALRFAFPAFMDGFVNVLPSISGGHDIVMWTNSAVASLLGEDAEWLRWASRIL